jgi:hypothetical protein
LPLMMASICSGSRGGSTSSPWMGPCPALVSERALVITRYFPSQTDQLGACSSIVI